MLNQSVGLAYSGSGTGTSIDPFQITTCVQLQEMSSSLSSYYILSNNIDCSDTVNWNSGSGFLPIGLSSPYFTGNLNGNNKTISQLTINRPSTNYVGLLARGASSFSVSDVTFTNVDITGLGSVGTVVGYASGTGSISNVTVSGTIDATASSLGGIAGSLTGVSISSSSTSGTITNTSSYNGGIVGNFQGTASITNTNSSANVTGAGNTGGIVGSAYIASYNSANVFNGIYSTGNITGTSSVGGAVGISENYRIVDSYATGTVTGGGYIGGFIGWSRGVETISQSWATGNVVSNSYHVGGFVGGNDSATFTRNYATGNVSGSYRVGGFIGYLGGTISDSYARGTATAVTSPAAGFAARGTGTISRSYSTGTATGTSANNYGFVGDDQYVSTCSSAFWDTQTSSKATSNCSATGKTTLQMKDIVTFTNTATTGLSAAWDFTGTQNNDASTNDYWAIDGTNNDGYPYLSYQNFTPPNASPTVGTLGPTNKVDASWGNDNTPALTFTTADTDVSNTVQYKIQIDNTSDFSSPVVDYTSALASPGASTFTVGQAQGTGTYTTGSASTTLGESTFYWRVKAVDNSAAESSYSTANSGSIAFGVDTVDPTIPGIPTTTSPTSDNTPTWTWTASTDATSGLNEYGVFWSPNSDFVPNTSIAEGTTSFTQPSPLADGTWYFKLYAYDEAGNISDFSQTSTVVIDSTAPTINNVTPLDNATNISHATDLVLNFSETVNVGTGNITVFKSSDNSLVEALGITSGNVTGDGTNTITVDLTNSLDFSTSYYVSIDATAFDDLSGNGYAGITDSTSWNFTTGNDTDSDSILDLIEVAGPNNGDANNDGIQDNQQAKVTSLVSPVNSNYVALESSTCAANTNVSIVPEPTQVDEADNNHQYPAGLLSFTLTGCVVGGSETITQYYYGDYDVGKIVLRKYNSTIKTYTTISNASLTSVTIGSKKAVKVVYVVVDGGTLDADGTANGAIVDPAGIGVLSTGTPNTGLKPQETSTIYILFALGALIIIGSYYGYKRTSQVG